MNEKLCFNGFIRARNGDRLLYDGKNTVTELGKGFVASAGLGKVFGNTSGMELGNTFIDGYTFYGYQTNIKYDATIDYMPTAYLLNLPAEVKAALSSYTSTIPLFDSNFEVDGNVLVGYATSKPTASAAKEGYLTELAGDIAINPNLHGLSYKWDAGTISGEYNTILIGSNIFTDKLNGFRINRGLDCNNVMLSEKEGTGYYLRPGVKTADGSIVYTTDQEILLGDATSLTNARRVLNMVTGVVTPLETTDHRYDFELRSASGVQMVYDNYLIYNDATTLIRMDLTTKTKTTIASSVYGGFIYDGYVYAVQSTTTIRAYALGSWSYTSSKNLTIANLNLPDCLSFSSANVNGLKICNIGDKFLVCKGNTLTRNLNDVRGGIICSDITNIGGSVVEVVPRTGVASGYVINGKKYFFCGQCPDIFMLNCTEYFYLNNSTSGVPRNKTGVKFTTEGLYGQVISFKTYDTPQTIDSSHSLIVDYSYGFE